MFLVLFPLFNSLLTQVFKGVTCKGGLDRDFFARGGFVARFAASFGGEENPSLFLSMYLYPLLNVVGCVWVFLSLLPLYYPWVGSLMFST